MKPNRRKAVVSDPIKRIGLNGGNSAREIVIQIARALGFKIHEDDKQCHGDRRLTLSKKSFLKTILHFHTQC